MPEADVVRLHPDRDLQDDDAALHRRHQSLDCRHRRATIDDDAHKLFCRDCDREIDPIRFLTDLMGRWEIHVRHRKEAARRANEAQTRLDEILRLERNARARLGKLDHGGQGSTGEAVGRPALTVSADHPATVRSA